MVRAPISTREQVVRAATRLHSCRRGLPIRGQRADHDAVEYRESSRHCAGQMRVWPGIPWGARSMALDLVSLDHAVLEAT